jgi:hypothetical protein
MPSSHLLLSCLCYVFICGVVTATSHRLYLMFL